MGKHICQGYLRQGPDLQRAVVFLHLKVELLTLYPFQLGLWLKNRNQRKQKRPDFLILKTEAILRRLLFIFCYDDTPLQHAFES